MPFGLHGAVATFQRLVDKLLQRHTAFAAAYIDDVVIFSRSWEENVGHLRQVLQTIQEAGLTMNPKKCKFGVRHTQYLGFVVGTEKLDP